MEPFSFNLLSFAKIVFLTSLLILEVLSSSQRDQWIGMKFELEVERSHWQISLTEIVFLTDVKLILYIIVVVYTQCASGIMILSE